MVRITRDHPDGADVKLEASGNVTLDNVREVGQTGVDYISVGALTHSAPAADFSLKRLNDE
jgi:nicotinate-nucleotide pyrophosphorylase (carboxylating)